MVKGIILAGGTGTRMMPCTKVTNKHLLPVYDKPMVYYPLQTLIEAGIKNIMIVSGRGHAGHFVNLLGSGKEFGVKLSYEVQEEAGGIAQALSLAEDFADNESIVVILGDNIFEDNIKDYIEEQEGCKIFLKEVELEAAKRFGCALVENGKVTYVEEKPLHPKSNLAMTGLYMFDSKVFDIIRTLNPSARGELEITDAIDCYVQKRACYYEIIKGFWSDAGTFESLFKASTLIRRKNNPLQSDLASDVHIERIYEMIRAQKELLKEIMEKIENNLGKEDNYIKKEIERRIEKIDYGEYLWTSKYY